MTNTWYASDWDQAYRPSYAKIRRTVVRHIQVHLYIYIVIYKYIYITISTVYVFIYYSCTHRGRSTHEVTTIYEANLFSWCDGCPAAGRCCRLGAAWHSSGFSPGSLLLLCPHGKLSCPAHLLRLRLTLLLSFRSRLFLQCLLLLFPRLLRFSRPLPRLLCLLGFSSLTCQPCCLRLPWNRLKTHSLSLPLHRVSNLKLCLW